MTADQFKAWLAEMKDAGLARSDAQAALLLGKNKNTVQSYKSKGADQSVALACRALLHRLLPYGE